MFNVLHQCSVNLIKGNDVTKHTSYREQRLKEYQHLLSNEFIASFIVDTNHVGGVEVHSINVNGLIYIYNMNTKKLITVLHPRPSQLKRYYRLLKLEIPSNIKKLCTDRFKRNEDAKLNKK